MTDPTLVRAEAAIAAGTPAGDLTGVELLALFERKAHMVRFDALNLSAGTESQAEQERGVAQGRAAALAITYAQEARQRYTEALAHDRGTHNPVDLEALDRAGVTAAEERARFERESHAG